MEKIQLSRPVDKEFPISSRFGSRMINGKEEFHNGVDFAVPVGTPVYACEDGAAFRCGWQDAENQKVGYGLRVWQEFERMEDKARVRYYIWLGHLSKILVKEGSRIKKGDLIAYSGNTGRSTGAHLHISVRKLDSKDFSDIEWV